jgi:hypothetical protein
LFRTNARKAFPVFLYCSIPALSRLPVCQVTLAATLAATFAAIFACKRAGEVLSEARTILSAAEESSMPVKKRQISWFTSMAFNTISGTESSLLLTPTTKVSSGLVYKCPWKPLSIDVSSTPQKVFCRDLSSNTVDVARAMILLKVGSPSNTPK